MLQLWLLPRWVAVSSALSSFLSYATVLLAAYVFCRELCSSLNACDHLMLSAWIDVFSLHQVDALLNDVDRCKSMGRAGRDVLVGKSDVADRYLEELLPFIDPPQIDLPLVDDNE